MKLFHYEGTLMTLAVTIAAHSDFLSLLNALDRFVHAMPVWHSTVWAASQYNLLTVPGEQFSGYRGI